MGNLLDKPKKPNTNWKYILIVVILAFLVGTGIFGYCSWIVKREVKTPEVQMREKGQKHEVTEEEEGKPKELEKADNQILLSEKNIKEIWEKEYMRGIDEASNLHYVCSMRFNHDSPTTEVLYVNRGKSISLKIPYNPNWGNEKYKISPYFRYEDKLEFGPLAVNPEGCGWERSFAMYFLPSRPAEEILSLLTELTEPRLDRVEKSTIVKEEINGHTIVRYVIRSELAGFDNQILEVVSKRYNYKFVFPFGGFFFRGAPDTEFFEYVVSYEDIIKNMVGGIQFIE